jgi:hypothetical protein
MELDYFLEDARDFIEDIPKAVWFGLGCDAALLAVLIARLLLHQQPF